MDGQTQVDTTQPISLEASKRLVEARLDAHFDRRIEHAKTMEPSYGRLWHSIHDLYAAGGKRLRPYITLLAYQGYATGKPVDAIVPAAAAQELLHLAMLIHDDIIDRDRVRYGVANVAGQYDSHYAKVIDSPDERGHFADSAAILAGDVLLSDAYGLTAQCTVEPRLILDAQSVVNDAVYTVVGGELLDTESVFNDRNRIRPLDIALLKTASYSFVSPLLMGAGFAGASDEQKAHLRTLGEAIGVAYQLQDDLLGIFGSSETTGKSVTSDLSEGKYTHLVELFYELADDKQTLAYEQIAGQGNVSDEDAEIARQLLERSGARAALEARIESLRSTAHVALMALTIPDAYKQELRMFLERMMEREK